MNPHADNEEPHSFLEKRPIPENAQDEPRTSCNAKKKESAKKKQKREKRKFKTHTDKGAVSMGQGSNKINTIVLECNPKYKINIHKSKVIWINDK